MSRRPILPVEDDPDDVLPGRPESAVAAACRPPAPAGHGG
jgi:hypothetical protein